MRSPTLARGCHAIYLEQSLESICSAKVIRGGVLTPCPTAEHVHRRDASAERPDRGALETRKDRGDPPHECGMRRPSPFSL